MNFLLLIILIFLAILVLQFPAKIFVLSFSINLYTFPLYRTHQSLANLTIATQILCLLAITVHFIQKKSNVSGNYRFFIFYLCLISALGFANVYPKVTILNALGLRNFLIAPLLGYFAFTGIRNLRFFFQRSNHFSYSQQCLFCLSSYRGSQSLCASWLYIWCSSEGINRWFP